MMFLALTLERSSSLSIAIDVFLLLPQQSHQNVLAQKSGQHTNALERAAREGAPMCGPVKPVWVAGQTSFADEPGEETNERPLERTPSG